jgi:fermentation-respiration switch protein FrsA (DUF1100 family)
MLRILIFFLGAGILVYAGALATLVLRQRAFIYRPGLSTQQTPKDFGYAYQQVRIPVGAGAELSGWWLKHEDQVPRAVLVYCHGNAANLSLLAEVSGILFDFGWDVLLFDYQGYGDSSPQKAGFSERALLADAQSAYDWVRRMVPENRIIVWGHSLGSAIAAQLAAKNKPAGLILEGAFPSLVEVAKRRYPWALVFRFMFFDVFATSDYLAEKRFPLLVVHGELDEVIQPRFGRAVFEKAPEPKEFLSVPGIGHKDFPTKARAYTEYFQKLTRRWLAPNQR